MTANFVDHLHLPHTPMSSEESFVPLADHVPGELTQKELKPWHNPIIVFIVVGVAVFLTVCVIFSLAFWKSTAPEDIFQRKSIAEKINAKASSGDGAQLVESKKISKWTSDRMIGTWLSMVKPVIEKNRTAIVVACVLLLVLLIVSLAYYLSQCGKPVDNTDQVDTEKPPNAHGYSGEKGNKRLHEDQDEKNEKKEEKPFFDTLNILYAGLGLVCLVLLGILLNMALRNSQGFTSREFPDHYDRLGHIKVDENPELGSLLENLRQEKLEGRTKLEAINKNQGTQNLFKPMGKIPTSGKQLDPFQYQDMPPQAQLVYKYTATEGIASYDGQFCKLYSRDKMKEYIEQNKTNVASEGESEAAVKSRTIANQLAEYRAKLEKGKNYSLARWFEEDRFHSVRVIPYKVTNLHVEKYARTNINRGAWTCYPDSGLAVAAELGRLNPTRLTSSNIDIPTDPNHYRDMFKLVLLGHAIGDAFGAPFESWRIGDIDQVDLEKFTPRKTLGAGTFTDDFAHGLVLADSLIEFRSLQGDDIYTKSLRWLWENYHTAYWERFGEGMTLLQVYGNQGVMDIEQKPAFGNGCVMRLSPVILFYMLHRDKADVLDMAGASTLALYPNVSCRDSARMIASVIYYFIKEKITPQQFHDSTFPQKFKDYYADYWKGSPPSAFLADIVEKGFEAAYRSSMEGFDQNDKNMLGSTRKREFSFNVKHDQSKGYLSDLSAHATVYEALYALRNTKSVMEGLKCVINTRDSDTNAAVFMMMALPLYGINWNNGDTEADKTKLPRVFRDTVYGGPAIELLGDLMYELAANHEFKTKDKFQFVKTSKTVGGKHVVAEGIVLENGLLRDFNPAKLPVHLQRFKLPEKPFVGAECDYLGDDRFSGYEPIESTKVTGTHFHLWLSNFSVKPSLTEFERKRRELNKGVYQ